MWWVSGAAAQSNFVPDVVFGLPGYWGVQSTIDLDGDGIDELVIEDEQRAFHVIRDFDPGRIEPFPVACASTPFAFDVTGDGLDDVVCDGLVFANPAWAPVGICDSQVITRMGTQATSIGTVGRTSSSPMASGCGPTARTC